MFKNQKKKILLSMLIITFSVCIYGYAAQINLNEQIEVIEPENEIAIISENDINEDTKDETEVKIIEPFEEKNNVETINPSIEVVETDTEKLIGSEEEQYEEEIITEEQEEVVEQVEQYSTPQHRSLGTFTLTAYCSCPKCCGKWSKYNKTESGTTPQQGRTVAVDKSVIPLGTKIMINGNEYIAEDTGSGVKRNHIDIYFNSHSKALNFGKQKAEVFVIE